MLRVLSCCAGKGCAAYTAKGIAAQEATGLPVMTQDPVLNQWLNPLFQMSSTSPSDYAADGDVASGYVSAQLQQQSVSLVFQKEAESGSQLQVWQHESLQQPAQQQSQQQPHQQPQPQPQTQNDSHHLCDSVSLTASCVCGAHAESLVVSNRPGLQSLLQLAEDAAGEELPGQVCQPEGHSRQVKGQGSCAERQAHDTEGQMCDLEGQTQAGSPSAPFPMLALDLVSSNAPAEGGSVVITDSQKAEALLDAQAQKAAAHLSAHIKQSPALARAQQQQPPVQVHAVCANAVSHNLQDAQICTAGGRATMTASHSAPASRQSGSHQKIEPLKYDHSGSIEGSSPARVLQELPSHQIPRHASIQQKQQKVLPKGQNSDALPCDKSVDSQQGRGRAAGHNGPGRGSCRGTDSVHDHDAVCAVVIETLAQQQQWRQRSAAVYHEARDAQHAMSFQSNTVPLASAAERPRQKLPMPWQPPGEQHCTAHLQKSDQIQQVVNLLTKGGSLC